MTCHFSLAASVALSFFACAASAEEISARCDGFIAYGRDARLCQSGVTVPFRSVGPDIGYAVRIATPATGCSDLSFIVQRTKPLFRRDRPVSIAQTRRLMPGQAQTLAIGAGYGPGAQAVLLTAIRHPGTCRGRAAGGWSATVTVAPAAG